MKYLFVVQGEGRGHMTQAISLAQILRERGHEVIKVLVGQCSNRELPQFFIDKIGAPVVRFKSPGMDYGKQGKRANIFKSIFANATPYKLAAWIKSMRTIAEQVRECEPDVVINLYELLMGATTLIHRLSPPVVSIAHQFLVDHPQYPHKAQNHSGQHMLSISNALSNLKSSKILSLSLYPLEESYRERMAVVPPLMRRELFEMKPYDGGYILAYMLNAAFIDEVIAWKKEHPEAQIHLFWDKQGADEDVEYCPGLWLHRINDQKFLKYMEGCSAYVTTAGFESVCEAMYLRKPVMMIPSHLEQEINAYDACSAGAGIKSDLFDISQIIDYLPNHTTDYTEFREWVKSAEDRFIDELTKIAK